MSWHRHRWTEWVRPPEQVVGAWVLTHDYQERQCTKCGKIRRRYL